MVLLGESDDPCVQPRSRNSDRISDPFSYDFLQARIMHGRFIFSTRLVTKHSGAQSTKQGVVDEALFLFEDLVALRVGTRGLELHCEFVLNQNLAFHSPSRICLFPFE